MKVLITGGTGIIGTRLAKLILDTGDQVRLFDAAPSPLSEDLAAAEVVTGDVCSPESLATAVAGVDRVVHLAFKLGAESSDDALTAAYVNVVGTTNLLEAARVAGTAQVLMASSVAVFGSDAMYDESDFPLRESAAPYGCPGLPTYGAGKIYMEKLADLYRDRYGMFVAGLRPSIVYGYGRKAGATSWMAQLVENPVAGVPTTVGFADAAVSLVSVDDVATQFHELLQASPEDFGETWFPNTGGDTTTITRLAAIVRELVPGAEISLSSEGEPDVSGLASRTDESAITRIVGHGRAYSPIETGIAAYINEARRHLTKG